MESLSFRLWSPTQQKPNSNSTGRAVITTFGLLSPSKGIEVMIDAMPSILQRRADAVYVVLGATHPNLVRDQGETYRESLMTRVRELGVQGTTSYSSTSSWIRRHCWNLFRCATSTSRPISTRRR